LKFRENKFSLATVVIGITVNDGIIARVAGNDTERKKRDRKLQKLQGEIFQ